MVEKLTTFAQEVTRVSLDVGTKGKLGGQAVVEGVEGTWQELTAVVNKLAENLTTQVRVSSVFLSSVLAVAALEASFLNKDILLTYCAFIVPSFHFLCYYTFHIGATRHRNTLLPHCVFVTVHCRSYQSRSQGRSQSKD